MKCGDLSHEYLLFVKEPKNVLALLDELETKEEQRANWFQMAQKLGEDLDTAEKRIAELESNPIATLDVQSGRVDGNKFALVYSSAAHKLPDDVYYLCVAAAGIGKGE
ncbi:TPA: ead/Ea22-like family protein [Citrobacter farmeri]|nr:ead/Ea22-like family protein [Citrobacter farmeri]HCD7631289.1 ead/Ea22-like family protein [Citrobacter farmeri]